MRDFNTGNGVLIEHGTPRGYYQHRKAHVTVCAECRAANTAYNRERRRKGTRAYWLQQTSNAARHRALASLAQIHPRDYRELYTDALAIVRAEREDAPDE